MEQYETIQQRNDELLNRNWRNEAMKADKHEQLRPEVLKLPEKYEDMFDEHIGRITTARYRIKQTHNNIHPVCSALHRAGFQMGQFAATEINRMSR